MDTQQELQHLRQLLLNYEELATDQEDDPSYVARGNGFCDAKYSTDFIEGRIAQLRQQIAQLEQTLH
ncbi:MAG: hypothetical protein IJV22_08730 [Bacteroidales bacterium]|nr:hypothetical protein [Bacteroidales bacterium]